mmetsp:Transcript_18271/g.21018  ORF Transcript_18271/g.21018 Transcript_18271/m.21018 type:complete len:91 (-) Transcript_18271:505-777(-)
MLLVVFLAAVTVREMGFASGRRSVYFAEFFHGTKETKAAKWFSFMLVIRRTLIVVTLIFSTAKPISTQVEVLVCVQSFYLALFVIIRPLK